MFDPNSLLNTSPLRRFLQRINAVIAMLIQRVTQREALFPKIGHQFVDDPNPVRGVARSRLG
jgi:hypothetical protein